METSQDKRLCSDRVFSSLYKLGQSYKGGEKNKGGWWQNGKPPSGPPRRCSGMSISSEKFQTASPVRVLTPRGQLTN